MDIHVPEVIKGEDVFKIMGQVFEEEGELYSNQYTFDLGSTREIDALALVSLHNLFAWLRSQRVEVKLSAPALASYAEDSLLKYIVAAFTNSIQVSRGMIPLSHVLSNRASTWVLTTFNRWLAEVLGVSTLSLYTPTQFLRLLLQYAVQDCGSAGAFVHACIQNDQQELRIILAHYGISIPRLIRKPWTALSNNAIDIAKSTELAMGEKGSLYFLVDDVIIGNGGELSIYSEFGRMKCLRTPFGLTQKLEMNNACFPGALFDVIIRLHATGLTSRINEPITLSEYENA